MKEREERNEEGERKDGKHWKKVEDSGENVERRGGKENKTRGTAVSDIRFTHV